MDEVEKARLLTALAPNRFGVIPTPTRLEANAGYTGKGVTIAILDSGFYQHPDLVLPENRIVEFVDICKRRSTLTEYGEAKPWDWHGTQTSVVAGGNGYASGGVYRSIAPDASIVLVKVGNQGRIRDEDIVRGLEWVIANRERFNIRVVNISLGGDEEAPYYNSPADQAAEEAIQQGLVVVAAAGNSGCTDDPKTRAPANSANVIAVGGYDDGNALGDEEIGTYCSSFGVTPDGLVKPDLVAPAIWIAAPILPDSPQCRDAQALSQLASCPDYVLAALARPDWGTNDQIEDSIRDNRRSLEIELPEGADGSALRKVIEDRLQQGKIIAAYYQHVDGTSFAAPIVSSVVAQMLEAKPHLTPQAVKRILISSAERLSGLPLLWQGYGMVRAGRAVELAAALEHPLSDHYFQPPRIDYDKVVFYHLQEEATSVHVAGDFNGWDASANPFVRDEKGIWHAEIDTPAPGHYAYKLVVDGSNWIEDPSNWFKAPDNHGGFNSILDVR